MSLGWLKTMISPWLVWQSHAEQQPLQERQEYPSYNSNAFMEIQLKRTMRRLSRSWTHPSCCRWSLCMLYERDMDKLSTNSTPSSIKCKSRELSVSCHSTSYYILNYLLVVVLISWSPLLLWTQSTDWCLPNSGSNNLEVETYSGVDILATNEPTKTTKTRGGNYANWNWNANIWPFLVVHREITEENRVVQRKTRTEEPNREGDEVVLNRSITEEVALNLFVFDQLLCFRSCSN